MADAPYKGFTQEHASGNPKHDKPYMKWPPDMDEVMEALKPLLTRLRAVLVWRRDQWADMRHIGDILNPPGGI